MTHPNDDPGKPMTDAFLRSCTDEQLVTLIRRTVQNPETLGDVANEVDRRLSGYTEPYFINPGAPEEGIDYRKPENAYTLCGKVLHPLNVNPCDRVAGHEGACVVRWKYVAPARTVTHELTD